MIPTSQQPDLEPAWWCLRTRPKGEHGACSLLRRMEGVESFCPRIRHRKATRRGPVWFVEALFPGYLFSRFSWMEMSRLVLATTGVSGVVAFGETRPHVPEEFVTSLRESFAEEETMTVSVSLEPGDQVEISDGPFRGSSAQVTRLLPARERVAVLLNFLGTDRIVEVPLLSVLGLRDPRMAAAGRAAA
jgi:transcriptional antiterminator RfaH